MTNKHMERCPTSLVLREKQIKATVRHHFTPTRVAGTTHTKEKARAVMCGEIGPPYVAGGVPLLGKGSEVPPAVTPKSCRTQQFPV